MTIQEDFNLRISSLWGPGVVVVFQAENISVGLGETFGQPECQQSPVIYYFLVSGFRFTEVSFGNGRVGSGYF